MTHKTFLFDLCFQVFVDLSSFFLKLVFFLEYKFILSVDFAASWNPLTVSARLVWQIGRNCEIGPPIYHSQ